MPTTVFSVIRNGIQNGYPFVEAYGSWLDYADQILVLDGYSNDGTQVVLHHLSRLSPKFRFTQAEWPGRSRSGSAIAEFTNSALEMAAGSADRLIYVQADEIFHSGFRRELGTYQGPPLRINRFVLFWNSFHKVIKIGEPTQDSTTHWEAVRAFPNVPKPVSTGDGLSFSFPPGTAFRESEGVILHYGWNFPVNILQKHVSHGRLYPDVAVYQKRASLSKQLLLRGRFSADMLDDLDPQYRGKQAAFIGEHPQCVRHLIDLDAYDPYIGLRLLERGVKW